MNRSQAPKGLVAITGASSGIGAAIATTLATRGYPVALMARRRQRLEQLAEEITMKGGCAFALPVDLACPNEVEAVSTKLQSFGYPLQVLVNNAGFAWYGYADAMPWAQAREMIAVNLAALTQLTLTFLPVMMNAGGGHIINIGSIAGSIPSQGVALYSATKSFIDSLTTAIYRELKGTEVHVSVVRAGAVSTPFYQSAAAQTGSRPIPVETLAISPQRVANRIVKLIQRPRRVVYIPGWLKCIPWVELTFGWLIDRIGPALLRGSLFHG